MFSPFNVDAITADTSDPTSGEKRGQEFIRALTALAQQRGHAAEVHARLHTFSIHGVPVEWFVYERAFQRKVPLTKKEARSGLFTDRAKREGKIEYRPSGWLTLVYRVDGRGETRLAERPRRRFEASPILDRFEGLAAEAAARRKAEEEEERRSRRRAAERVRSRRVETSRWNAMHGMMAASEKAARLRDFIERITSHSPMRPDQEKRVRKWARWANAHADAIDPMTKGFDDVLARLGLGKR